MTTTHVLDQYPSEDRTPADIIEKYYAQAIHDLIHLCNPIQGVAKTWMAQAKNEATWAKLTNTWWESNARPPIEEATLNMETTIQRYYSDHYCRPLLLTFDR
jgi:hypothetical protein